MNDVELIPEGPSEEYFIVVVASYEFKFTGNWDEYGVFQGRLVLQIVE